MCFFLKIDVFHAIPIEFRGISKDFAMILDAGGLWPLGLELCVSCSVVLCGAIISSCGCALQWRWASEALCQQQRQDFGDLQICRGLKAIKKRPKNDQKAIDILQKSTELL